MYLLALLPNAMNFRPIAFGVAFGLGGLLEGLYTLGLICIAKYYRGLGISSANGRVVATITSAVSATLIVGCRYLSCRRRGSGRGLDSRSCWLHGCR